MPNPECISIGNLRRTLPKVIDGVFLRGSTFVVTKNGLPFAKIVRMLPEEMALVQEEQKRMKQMMPRKKWQRKY